ncbi:MAG: hypothetical protein HRT35_01425 [Algicola sp.]|nr:hypothetical protein [Algicola sp.]
MKPVKTTEFEQGVDEALKLVELKRFVDVGIQAADEGRVKPLSKELMEGIKARGRQRV